MCLAWRRMLTRQLVRPVRSSLILLALALLACGGGPSATGTLSGLVTDGQGHGLPGVDLETQPSTGYAVSGADGAWKLENVPAGTYSVTASRSGYAPSTRSGVTLAARGTALVDFVLSPLVLVGRVGGKVTDAKTSLPLAGATLGTAPDAGRATAGADGTYLLEGLPVGQYRVLASAAGYVSATSPSVTVSADATTTVDLSLSPAVVYESTCAECHVSADRLLADLAADPLPPATGSESTGEG